MTITLPNFCDDLMIALEQGRITDNLFSGWKKRRCLPAFLSGFTSVLFEEHDGSLVAQPNAELIGVLRQLCLFYKKEKALCHDRRISHAYEEYRDIEIGLSSLVRSIAQAESTFFKETSRLIWSRVFKDEAPLEPHPYHGPGSTADKFVGNRKYSPKKPWIKSLDRIISSELAYYSSEECAKEDPVQIRRVRSMEAPVRVIAVPKTASKPRLIAMEPASVQMVQQPIKDYIVRCIQDSALVGGQVNFDDQSVNQRLARESSRTGHLATIDMSAASDRIHKKLIWDMLSFYPRLREQVFASRSRYADVEGEVRKLHKFASMGSATCFPLESMFFYTLCVCGFLKGKRLPLTADNVTLACKECYVYGDDIIVPVGVVEDVYTFLTVFGGKVGIHKSFYKGRFRESCGVDAYAGVDITSTYLRKPLPQRLRGQASEIISSVATANQLYNRGWCRAAYYVRSTVEAVTGPLPVSNEDIGGLAWTFGIDDSKKRYNRRLCRYEVRTLCPSPVMKADRLDGYQALTKCLSTLERRPYKVAPWLSGQGKYCNISPSEKEHLARSPRRGAVTLKHRWVGLLA